MGATYNFNSNPDIQLNRGPNTGSLTKSLLVFLGSLVRGTPGFLGALFNQGPNVGSLVRGTPGFLGALFDQGPNAGSLVRRSPGFLGALFD